jgi:hypothetical protein
MIDLSINSICKVFISEAKDGNVDPRFSSHAESKKNLQNLFKIAKINSSSVAQVEQVHGIRVVKVEKQDMGKIIINADGMITNNPGICLLIRLADCFPIFIMDYRKKVVGLLHSGWRGTIGKIVVIGILAMINEYGCRISDLNLLIGPGIQKCCFVLPDPFLFSFPDLKPYIHDKSGQNFFDISGYIKQCAIETGVKETAITVSPVCTVDSHTYFSHTKSTTQNLAEARFAAMVSLN